MIDARCRGLGVLGKVVVERGEVLADEDPHLLLVVADRLLPASTPLGPRLGGSRPRLRKLGLQLLALPAHVVTGECAPFEFGEATEVFAARSFASRCSLSIASTRSRRASLWATSAASSVLTSERGGPRSRRAAGLTDIPRG